MLVALHGTPSLGQVDLLQRCASLDVLIRIASEYNTRGMTYRIHLPIHQTPKPNLRAR